MLLVTRGGLIPGGLLAEALKTDVILTAAVDFPAESQMDEERKQKARLLAWPQFVQFPDNECCAAGAC